MYKAIYLLAWIRSSRDSMARRLFEEASHAVSYAMFRPSYPRELVEAILSYCKKHGCGRQTAVDVGCGSGQSTKLIARKTEIDTVTDKIVAI